MILVTVEYRNMAQLEPALVLTWSAHGVKVRCPFNCDRKFHNHGCTMPESGIANSRLAHCVSTWDTDSLHRDFPRYRLLFPFENDPLTDGLWWEIDHGRSCWRTIGWDVDDPQHDERIVAKAGGNPEGEDTDEEEDNFGLDSAGESDDDSDDIVTAFEALSVRALGECKEKELFDSYCVTNNVKSAQSILDRSNNPEALINEVCISGKPILLAACEEGHLEVVGFLLKHSADLEATNESGKTALIASISNGYGRIACMLIRAGARIDVVNTDGQPLLNLSRYALQRHEEFRGMELHPVYADSLATRTRLRKRELEISALRDIIDECELQEAIRLAERKRQRLVTLHGEYQANRFIETNTFDQAEIISEMLRKMARTPRQSEWKTTACLTRGTALPYTLAVSGYSDGPFGSHDGALDRPTWTRKAFQLADLLGHELPGDQLDEEGRPGSFYACHAEKQVLSFMIWNHTTALGDVDEVAPLDRCEAPSLSQLHVEIFVWQPARKLPYICFDCAEFCAKAAEKFKMSLSLLLVHESNVELAQSWP